MSAKEICVCSRCGAEFPKELVQTGQAFKQEFIYFCSLACRQDVARLVFRNETQQPSVAIQLSRNATQEGGD